MRFSPLCLMALLAATPAYAGFSLSDVALLEVKGRVMADHVGLPDAEVELSLDLDRDGQFSYYEKRSATTGADGSYEIEYIPNPVGATSAFVSFAEKLVDEFQRDGFTALVRYAPLPVAVTFRKEGYGTVSRPFSVLSLEHTADATLHRLQPLACAKESCLTPDGSVELQGLPSTVNRAYARAYSPAEESDRFPGPYADAGGSLLVSAGFAEIDLRTKGGESIQALDKPVQLRFRIEPTSWGSIVDQASGTSAVELPVYSFNEESGEWTAEKQGRLIRGDGTPVPERDLGAIRDGSYVGDVYASIEAAHFSTWNIDQPVSTHTCVKGRLVNPDGTPKAGAQVTVKGVSYDGWLFEVTADSDGRFAMGAMKSEGPGEDVDGNGVTGETFRARVALVFGDQVLEGPEFDTPTLNKRIIENKGLNCLPAACECPDLGDVVVTPHVARICTITGRVTFSGSVTDRSREPSAPLARGAALASVTVSGESPYLTPAEIERLCTGSSSCAPAVTNGSGEYALALPVLREFTVEASFEAERPDTEHLRDYYRARKSVSSCPDGQFQLDLEADYAALTPAEFSLYEGADEGPSCSCGSGGGSGASAAAQAALFGLPVFVTTWMRRERRRRSGAVRGKHIRTLSPESDGVVPGQGGGRV